MLTEKYTQKRKPLNSKVVKTEENQLLMKYGHAYFPLRSIQKSQVSSRANALLNSYPCWFIKQSFIHTQQFKYISRQIVSVDTKEIYIFQEKDAFSQFLPKFKILSSIDGISFTHLKVLHIMLIRDNNFEEIGWLNAPVLEQLYVSTQGSFTSIKPLQKSCFKHLYLVNFRIAGQNKKLEGRMFDLKDFHRTRLLCSKYSQFPNAKIYTPPGTVSIYRSDYSNINIFPKLELQRFTNFHIPHLEIGNNQHHRFTPNLDYPWCPQLQFCQCKMYRTLNKKFDNKTIALSIIDYVLDQDLDHERRYVRRNRVLDQGLDDEQQGHQEIDSDLD